MAKQEKPKEENLTAEQQEKLKVYQAKSAAVQNAMIEVIQNHKAEVISLAAKKLKELGYDVPEKDLEL